MLSRTSVAPWAPSASPPRPCFSARDDARACPTTAPLVLIVDDDDDTREMLGTILDLEGYAVVSAIHGAEALERLRECRPDLIILDQMMPVMDGPTFIAAQRRDPSLAEIPVLAITASMQFHVDGATAFMRKPVDLDCLLATVARCVAMGAARGHSQLNPA